MTIGKTSLLAGALFFLFNTTSPAEIVRVTYTGTVIDALDQNGLFGSAGGSLVGGSWTATYVFDTTLGLTFMSPTYNYATGGWGSNTVSAGLSAVVTINGISVAVPTPYLMSRIEGDGQNQNNTRIVQNALVMWSQVSGDITTNYRFQNAVYNPDLTLPTTISTPFTYTLHPGDYSLAYFDLHSYDGTTQTYFSQTAITAVLSAETLEIVTPLPGALPLLATGLGFVGLIGWRRKRRTAVGSVQS